MSPSIVIIAQAQHISDNNDTINKDSCIRYDDAKRLIVISCTYPTNLTSIYKTIQNPDVIKIENETNNSPVKNWILNASILVEKGSTFIINKNDTKWLKILQPSNLNSTSDNHDGSGSEDVEAYSILVLGSLKIDSVKISSWDPQNSDYIKFEFTILPDREHQHTGIDAVPRPFIKVEDETTGTTNITNSEISYLGYECGGGCSGISYYGSNGTSIIKIMKYIITDSVFIRWE